MDFVAFFTATLLTVNGVGRSKIERSSSFSLAWPPGPDVSVRPRRTGSAPLEVGETLGKVLNRFGGINLHAHVLLSPRGRRLAMTNSNHPTKAALKIGADSPTAAEKLAGYDGAVTIKFGDGKTTRYQVNGALTSEQNSRPDDQPGGERG